MLTVHSLFGVNSKLNSVRGFVLVCGANAASAKPERAVGCAEFLKHAQRMAAELDRRPPPGREATGQRLALAVKKRLHPQARQDNTQPLAEHDTAGERLRRAVQARLPKRPRPAGHKQPTAANAEETLGERLARITKARAKGIRVCRN